MSDEFVVKRVGPPAPDYNFQAIQAQQQNQAVIESVKASTTVKETEKQSESKPEDERSKDNTKFNINLVDLQFEVNNDTGDVTVKIVDRETKEILRTIPQRDFRDLSVAELFSFST
jgi:uncharacterized FlaG/YvyC family protein